MDNKIKFTITAEDVEKENDTWSGQLVDFLAVASSWWEWNECTEQNFSYIDESIENTFNEIDHESAYIEHLNKTLPPVDGLKAGAYCALNKPKSFANRLEEWVEKQREAMAQCLGEYSHMPEPYATELAKAYDWYEDNLRTEWLQGDRSHTGVLHEIQTKLFGTYAPFEYNDETDTFTAIISREDAIEEMDVQKPTAEKVKRAYIDYFVRKFNTERQEQHEKAEKQRKEWQETQAYKQEREEKEKQARIEHLQSMKA